MNSKPNNTIDPKLILAARGAVELQALINAAKLHSRCEGDTPDTLIEMIDSHINDLTTKLGQLTHEFPF